MKNAKNMTVAELQERANAAGIKGYSRMRKEELVAALQSAEKSVATATQAETRAPRGARKAEAHDVQPERTTSVEPQAAAKDPERTSLPNRLDAPSDEAKLSVLAGDSVVKPADAFDGDRPTSTTLVTASLPPRLTESMAPDHRQAKFGPTQPRTEGLLVESGLSELPDSYGVDRLVLLARDPQWAFCYWELTPALAARAMVGLSGPMPVIRVTHWVAPGDPGMNYEESVHLYGGRHYLRVPQAGRHYRVELGFKGTDGRFAAALVSNEVIIPPDDISPVVEDHFASISVHEPLVEAAAKIEEVIPPSVWNTHEMTIEQYRQQHKVAKNIPETWPGSTHR